MTAVERVLGASPQGKILRGSLQALDACARSMPRAALDAAEAPSVAEPPHVSAGCPLAQATDPVPLRVLVVDHADSFTRNLVHMLEELGALPTVVSAFGPRPEMGQFDAVVLSPGPGSPLEASDVGFSRDLVRDATDEIPILGVCFGHQLLAHHHGAAVGRARRPMHGRSSTVVLEGACGGDPVFGSLPREFAAVRYHSLAVGEAAGEAGGAAGGLAGGAALPGCLLALAHAREPDGARTLMALRHRTLPQWGVQYHPESIGSECGLKLLANFLDVGRRLASARSAGRPSARPEALDRHNLRERTSALPRLPSAAPGGASARRPPQAQQQQQLRFSRRRLAAGLASEGVFDAFAGLARPRVLLESARVIPGFSRYSTAAGAPYLGPLSYTLAYFRGRRLARCRGPGAPFAERCVDSSEAFFDLLSELLPADAVESEAPFDFAGGLVGYLGYELRPGAPEASEDTEVPDACFLFVDRFLAYDHLMSEAYVCSLEPADAKAPWAESEEALEMASGSRQAAKEVCGRPQEINFTMAHSHEEYIQCVERCQEHIRAGETYELCLTTRFMARAEVDPLSVFRHLREVNPAPYSFMYDFNAQGGNEESGFAVLGSSPERFLQVDRNGVAFCKPMKGTARRDLADAENDDRIKRELADSEKDKAENLMIVDLVRHDLSAICEPASVRCPQLMDVETFAAVHQLVSLVRGQLPAAGRGACGTRLVEVLRACFPAGSMTGAPKLRSMELLHGLEKQRPRGVFSGASGYLSVTGAADLAVVIRTMVVRRGANPCVTIGAGGAVTLLSEPQAELEEMLLKAERLLQAIARYAPTRVEARHGGLEAVAPAPATSPAALAAEGPTVLETMLVQPGRDGGGRTPYLWDLHYRRLSSSCRHLQVPLPSEADLLALCAGALGEATGPQRLRLTVGARGARAECSPVQVPPSFPLDLVSAPRRICLDIQPGVHSGDPLLGHKTLWRGAYTQARQRVLGEGGAGAAGLFDVVLYNERLEVTETSIANLALETEDGGWRTPPLACGLLPGVMRARMLETGELHEGIITVEQLVAAAAAGRLVLCFNSVRGAYLATLVREEQHGLRPTGLSSGC